MADVLASNVRYAEVLYGDDLRKIALRELGDASFWLDLIALNGLRPPYVAAEASDGVVGYGDQIAIPAATSDIAPETDPTEVYGTDLKIVGKRLTVENGDFAIVSGVPNLMQALVNHIVVDKNELAFHPSFGSYVRSLIGRSNGPTAGQLAAFYAKSALAEDDRVRSVVSVDAVMTGDQIKVDATVLPITGKPVNLQVIV